MEKAGKYAQASGNPTFITTHNQNLALLYLDMGETGLAKELLLKILDIYDKEQDASNLHVLALQILAPLYVEEKQYTEALELYEKALEIILSLSLNFPEKSIYFADQIRFLRKLIVNEKYKQKKQ